VLSICEIRKAELSNAEEIGELIAMLAQEFITHEFTPDAERQFLASNDRESVKEFMKSGFSYHVAVDGGRIVGVVGVKNNSHLYHLFIDIPYQGMGLARQLWQAAMDDCISSGNLGIFTVNSSNNAVGVYEKFGFVRVKPMQNDDGVFYNPMELRNDC
jgi:ribosomal protein S18 acetylase RimI-like enzyme